MRRFIIYILLLSGGWLLSSFELTSDLKEEESYVVVELFTSQGCSSCPAADKVLSDLMTNNERILALSFHVSYWNYLGWKDPYSKDEFTNRQRKYSRAMDLGRVYTPQMIVNGNDEFVGSNKSQAEKYVKEALKKQAQHKIGISVKLDGNTIKGQYKLEGKASDYLVNLALVERDVSNTVPRGENRGRTLHHDNVVHALEVFTAKKSDDFSISLPSAIDLEKSSIIAYVQHAQTLNITGATKIAL